MSTAIATSIAQLIGLCSISFVKLKNTKSSLLILQYRFRNSPRWWSFLYINQSKYLSRQALLFPTWDWRRSYSIKANKLACYQPNSLDAPSRRTKLACHQPASLVCLVCCQPIPPSYLTVWSVLFVINQFLLIITIAFKRGKQHQCRYIRNSVGLLCHFNPLKAVLSDCSHCFQKNWAHQCRCIRNNAGLLCRLISWKQCQSFMSPFPVWRKQYSMIIT